MGRNISQTHFSQQDYAAFSERLHTNLEHLDALLKRPDFGPRTCSLGAELEYYLIDPKGNASFTNREIQAASCDEHVTVELNRYNLEYNFDVIAIEKQPFSELEAAIRKATQSLNAIASQFNAQLLSVGILPSLQESDLGFHAMTPIERYQVLSDTLLTLRGGEFEIDIHGPTDQLYSQRKDLTLEGACTSFQIHFCFPLNEFVNTWNAMTLATPLVLALSTNSPLLLGKQLWQETRVPLFKQATDGRRPREPWRDLPRVDLGYDWLRHSAYELFAQRVYLYPPLMPVCQQGNETVSERELPPLAELALHNGTVWHWNRPIYSNEDNGHVRIEMRSLPSGPSTTDMVANAALHIGLAVGLRNNIERLLPAMPFRFVSENFYAAARDGIDSKLIWPSERQNSPRLRPVRELGLELLNVAENGLSQLGVEKSEREHWLGIIRQRLDKGITGSRWLESNYRHLQRGFNQADALRNLTLAYLEHSNSNQPVANWPQTPT